MPPLLTSFDDDDLDAIVRHPLQAWAVETIGTLLHDLPSCERPEDYSDFQKLLFQLVWTTETRRSEVRRAWKRLKKHLSIPGDAPELPAGRDPADEESWRLEDLTIERVLRQLRSVGDALAWRVSGYDRRYILAVSRNASPGPMAGKEGLGWELGAVEDLMRDQGHFALLHDLTSCLRIGDLTEFTADGRLLLHEVKKGASRSREQVRRMEAAVQAVNNGAPLPGTAEQLVSVDAAYATHLPILHDALSLAEERGTVGMKVPGGRALVASNLLTMAGSDRFADPTKWPSLMDQTRARALRRAGISEHRHHLNMRSADWAARSPSAVPYGVYPLAPEQAAALICDFAVVEIVLSVDALFDAVKARGLQTELLLPDCSGELRPGQAMFRFTDRDRAVVVHSGATAQLLGELLTTDAFLAGLSALLTMDRVPASPVITFKDEASAWV